VNQLIPRSLAKKGLCVLQRHPCYRELRRCGRPEVFSSPPDMLRALFPENATRLTCINPLSRREKGASAPVVGATHKSRLTEAQSIAALRQAKRGACARPFRSGAATSSAPGRGASFGRREAIPGRLGKDECGSAYQLYGLDGRDKLTGRVYLPLGLPSEIERRTITSYRVGPWGVACGRRRIMRRKI
jgi:hypothetical protein